MRAAALDGTKSNVGLDADPNAIVLVGDRTDGADPKAHAFLCMYLLFNKWCVVNTKKYKKFSYGISIGICKFVLRSELKKTWIQCIFI